MGGPRDPGEAPLPRGDAGLELFGEEGCFTEPVGEGGRLAELGDGTTHLTCHPLPCSPLEGTEDDFRPGEMFRLTRGEVGGVMRFVGGEEGVLETLEGAGDPKVPPRDPIRREFDGLFERSRFICLVGEVLGDTFGDSFSLCDPLLELPTRGSGDKGLRRCDPSGGGPGPTGDRTSLECPNVTLAVAVPPCVEVAEEEEVKGCFATKGPFFETPSPFRRRILKAVSMSFFCFDGQRAIRRTDLLADF